MFKPKQPAGRVKALFSRKNKIIGVTALVVIAAGITVAVLLTTKNEATPNIPASSSDVYDIYAERLSDLKTIAEQNPTDPSSLDEYATALRATSNYEEAKKQYERIVELNPTDSLTYNNLGNTLRDLGEYDSATTAYQKSLELNPKQINGYINLASLRQYQQNDINAAIEVYKKALTELPGDETLTLQLALTYEQNGDTANAKATAQKLLDKNPENTTAKKIIERANAS